MSASSVGSVTPMPSATEPQFVLFDCMWEGHTEPMHLRQLSVKHWGSADILSLIIKNNGRMVHAKRKAIGDVIAAQYKSLEEEILAGQDYSNCLYRIGVLREMRTVCLNVAGRSCMYAHKRETGKEISGRVCVAYKRVPTICK